jgi:hypothetical protein
MSKYPDWLTRSRAAFDGLVRDHPLAVALAGLAAGVAVAASLPVTKPERRVLGPARHRLSEAAERAGEKISKAGVEAGQRLIRGVAERAVSTGLEQVAGEPARGISAEQENSPLGARAAGSSANKSGADQLTSDSQREEEQSSEEAKAAKAVLDAQQKAVDDIRAGRPAPYYFTAPQSSVSSGETAPSGADNLDAQKK